MKVKSWGAVEKKKRSFETCCGRWECATADLTMNDEALWGMDSGQPCRVARGAKVVYGIFPFSEEIRFLAIIIIH